ncbi:hypothetical protein [Klebsiella phage vB_KshKPC-M]|nr:hypothetical protein [Klebsiella phage vB_KshKPC-M]
MWQPQQRTERSRPPSRRRAELQRAKSSLRRDESNAGTAVMGSPTRRLLGRPPRQAGRYHQPPAPGRNVPVR